MKAKLFLFALLLASTMKLEAIVLPNIALYFDGKDFIIETNANENVEVTKTDTLLTIVPAL